MKAYFTVEAALILPLTLWVWVSLIYLMFFQYDRCLMEQDMAAIAMKGCASWENNNEETVRLVKRQAAAIDRDRFLAFRYGELDIEMMLGKLTVAAEGEVRVPFQQLMQWVQKEHWQVKARFTNRQLEPILIIRAYKKLIREEWGE